jgi:hypothetical protein
MQAKANNKAMLEAAEQNIKDLEYAKQNMWHPSKDYFEQIRQKLTIC